jgi:hypothetical protein
MTGPYPELADVIVYMADNWEPVQPEEDIIMDYCGSSEKLLDFMKR